MFKSEAKQSHLWISSSVKCTSLKTKCLISRREEANKVDWHLAPKLGARGSESGRLPNIGCPHHCVLSHRTHAWSQCSDSASSTFENVCYSSASGKNILSLNPCDQFIIKR